MSELLKIRERDVDKVEVFCSDRSTRLLNPLAKVFGLECPVGFFEIEFEEIFPDVIRRAFPDVNIPARFKEKIVKPSFFSGETLHFNRQLLNLAESKGLAVGLK